MVVALRIGLNPIVRYLAGHLFQSNNVELLSEFVAVFLFFRFGFQLSFFRIREHIAIFLRLDAQVVLVGAPPRSSTTVVDRPFHERHQRHCPLV